MSSLEKMPKLKVKVIDKLTEIQNNYMEQEGLQGKMAGERTRIRLKSLE